MPEDHKHHGHSHDQDHDAHHEHSHGHGQAHAHGHGHGHGHGDHDGHDHSVPNDFSTAFAVGVLLNTVFVGAEAIYGYFANSLALIADAGHNLSDVLGLLLAWGAVWLSKRQPSASFSYGLRSSSILASLANAILLLVVTGGIAWESIMRLQAPAEVATGTVMTVAAIGILVNGLTAYLFHRGRKSDLNIRAAYAHMLSDAVVSLGVVIAGLVIAETHWFWLDPAISLVVSAVIIMGTWGILRESINLALQGVPPGVRLTEVETFLSSAEGVKAVHDLHIWAMSTTETALTAHLVVPTGHPGDAFLKELCRTLRESYSIHHTTIQIELGDGASCELESPAVV